MEESEAYAVLRSKLNDQVEELLSSKPVGYLERVAQLASEMEVLLGADGSCARSLLHPVSFRNMSFVQKPQSSSDELGFVVWEGAFELCEFLVAHAELVRDKDVVELGCGAGIWFELSVCSFSFSSHRQSFNSGIVCAKELGAKKVVLTDMARVVKREKTEIEGFVLRKSAQLSLAEENVSRNSVAGRASCSVLEWGDRECDLRCDVAIGAELVSRFYDSDKLLQTIGLVFWYFVLSLLNVLFLSAYWSLATPF
jgi:hypothetical protein